MKLRSKIILLFLSLTLQINPFFSPPQVFADNLLPEHLITTQGTGLVTAQPDAVQISLGVETEAPTLEQARSESSQKMTAVLQQLKSLGIPKLVLKTSGFNVFPVREIVSRTAQNPQKPAKIIAYRITHRIEVKIEGVSPERVSDYASKVIDTAIHAGANFTNNISFYLSHNNTAQQEAIRLAIEQARKTAETAAQSAGVHITDIYDIETFAQSVPMRQSFQARSAAVAEENITPVESGDLNITASVTVRFRFQP